MSGENAPARRREAEDPRCPAERLVELSADDNFFVRRAAGAHPALPAAVLELWNQAGSTADLAGFGPQDAALPSAELDRLARLGPWGARLAARHPATGAATLESLATHPSAALRADLASHPQAPAQLLERLLLDSDPTVRARAASHPLAPPEILSLLTRAADPDATLSPAERARLEAAGPHGRRLLARRRELSTEECARLAADVDEQVRRAVLSHPLVPGTALARAVEEAEGALEVLALAATHPAASPELLGWLVLHGPASVRQAAGAHGAFPAALRGKLTRAGASSDFAGFAACDPTLKSHELDTLARAGAWARLLAARHPATSAEVLGHLLADGDPLVREAAATHPHRPKEIHQLLVAAGSTAELDGLKRQAFAPLEPEKLDALATLGPWARRLAARHPQAGSDLLEQLSLDPEPQVRAEVAAHAAADPGTVLALAGDLSPAVRWAVARRQVLSEAALIELAASPEATLRAQVASHADTPANLRQRLARDPDEGVRQAAQGR